MKHIYLPTCGVKKMLALLGCVIGRLLAEAPVDIGHRLELFVDNYLIEHLDGVEFRLHEPHVAETSLTFDRAWEGNTSGYASVIKVGKKYRMYYRGHSLPKYALANQVRSGEVIVPEHVEVVCAVESLDGIHWERPNLGLYEFNGSKENNIVWMGQGTHNFAPFLDANPDTPPDQRYKAVASFRPKKNEPSAADLSSNQAQFSYFQQEQARPALYYFVSPDGLNWKRGSEAPIITDGYFDSLNVAFWDEVRSEYTAIYRDFDRGIRTFKYSHSKDFKTWSAGRWADFGSAPLFHLYTNAATPSFRAPHIYLAIPRRYLPWKTFFKEMDQDTPGSSDAILMSSRNGINWHVFPEAFIRPGLNGRNWSHRANTPVHGIIQTSDTELSIYMEREYTFASNRIERLTLRTDGFVSIHAGYPGGEFRTKPFIFDGSQLLLNYSTSANGSVRIEIQSENGQPIPGFHLEESPLIFGDEIKGIVDWGHAKGITDRSPIEALAGKTVRLRVVMREADLYSIQFSKPKSRD